MSPAPTSRPASGYWTRPGPRLVLRTALTLAATWLILRGVGVQLSEVTRVQWAALEVDPVPLTLSVVSLGGAFVLTAWFWSRLVVALGGRGSGVWTSAAMVMVANLGRYIPGKVFQLAGLAFLAKRRGIAGVTAGTAAVAGQILHLLAAAIVGGWVALEFAELSLGWGTALASATLLALIGLARSGIPASMLRWAFERGGHVGDLPNLAPSALLTWLFAYTLNWFALGAAFFLLSRGLGLELSLLTATTAFAGAYLVGYLAVFAPAGIGIREASLVAFLTPSLGFEGGIALASMQRVWITGVELVGAVAGAIYLKAGLKAEGEATVPPGGGP